MASQPSEPVDTGVLRALLARYRRFHLPHANHLVLAARQQVLAILTRGKTEHGAGVTLGRAHFAILDHRSLALPCLPRLPALLPLPRQTLPKRLPDHLQIPERISRERALLVGHEQIRTRRLSRRRDLAAERGQEFAGKVGEPKGVGEECVYAAGCFVLEVIAQ